MSDALAHNGSALRGAIAVSFGWSPNVLLGVKLRESAFVNKAKAAMALELPPVSIDGVFYASPSADGPSFRS